MATQKVKIVISLRQPGWRSRRKGDGWAWAAYLDGDMETPLAEGFQKTLSYAKEEVLIFFDDAKTWLKSGGSVYMSTAEIPFGSFRRLPTAPDFTLLRAARDHILAAPSQLDMASWVDEKGEACGTTACIAGWVTLLAGIPRARSMGFYTLNGRQLHTADAARELLGITLRDCDRVFYSLSWSPENSDLYGAADTGSPEAALAAANEINLFIAEIESRVQA